MCPICHSGSAAANAFSQFFLAMVLFLLIYCTGLHKPTWSGELHHYYYNNNYSNYLVLILDIPAVLKSKAVPAGYPDSAYQGGPWTVCRTGVCSSGWPFPAWSWCVWSGGRLKLEESWLASLVRWSWEPSPFSIS